MTTTNTKEAAGRSRGRNGKGGPAAGMPSAVAAGDAGQVAAAKPKTIKTRQHANGAAAPAAGTVAVGAATTAAPSAMAAGADNPTPANAATVSTLWDEIARAAEIGKRLKAAGSPLAVGFATENPEEVAAYLLRERLDGLESNLTALQLA